MHALVIYESMYGNTHALAEAIGRGLGTRWTVSIVPVVHADEQVPSGSPATNELIRPFLSKSQFELSGPGM